MRFLQWQQDWINDRSRLKILEKSRRIGGSFSTSYAVFRELLDYTGHDVTVVSRDETLSTEFVRAVAAWQRLWNVVQPSHAIPEDGIRRLGLTIPHHAGESRLIAVSSNPNAAAGKGGSLVIDELALHRDPEMLMSIAQPIIMSGGRLAVLSTHRSRNSLFNKLVKESQEPGSQWSHHRTTIYDAVEQGLVEQVVNPNMVKLGNDPYADPQDFIDWLKATYDEHTFAQEFCCVPSDDACSLLSIDEVDAAVERLQSEGSLKHGGTFLGYDCAESVDGDYAAVSILRWWQNEVELVLPHYFPLGTPIERQLDKVVALAKEYNVRRVVSDNAGIGRHPTSILKRRLGETRVVAFNPTMQSKAAMCTKAKRFFQNKRFRMPDDEQVREDYLSIDRIVTPSNNVVYHSTSRSGHGDMFSATAMALTEVPEDGDADIVGVARRNPQAMDVQSVEGPVRSIRERIERNRRLDRKKQKKFTM